MLATKSSIYHFGEFHLDTSARLLARKGQRVPLGSKAFEVLLCLVRHAGEVVTKDVLLKTVWPNSFVEENNLTQHIFSLRKALADRADYIVTVPSRGYQFAGRVLEIEPAIPKPPAGRQQREGEAETAVPPASIKADFPVATRESVAHPMVAEASRETLVRGSRTLVWAGLAAFATAMLVMGGGWMRARAAKRGGHHYMIVLAAFNNTTGDTTFDRTLERALEIELEQRPNAGVMSEREAMMTLERMGRRSDEAMTPEVAKTLCERAQAQVVVAASIASLGGEYLVTLQATDCVTGKSLAGAKAEAATKEKVIGALDKAAAQLNAGLEDAAQ